MTSIPTNGFIARLLGDKTADVNGGFRGGKKKYQTHHYDQLCQISFKNQKIEVKSQLFLYRIGAQTDLWMVSLCTATNKKLLTFLFWKPTKAYYVAKWLEFQEKLIDTITNSNFNMYLKKTMLFGLVFILADGRAKLAQQLILMVLPFHALFFPWIGVHSQTSWHEVVQEISITTVKNVFTNVSCRISLESS